MQTDDPKEIFDATIETEDLTQSAQSTTQDQIAAAKIRAEHQNKVAATMVDEIISQKKKSFRRTLILSVSSVVILLILAIVFFIYLRWYGVGAGVAVLAFVVAQIWLSFFKKWGYNTKSCNDFGEDDYLPNEIENEQPQRESPESNENKQQENKNKDDKQDYNFC